MSDNFLRLIPTVPNYVPTKRAQVVAHRLLQSFAPKADEIRTQVSEQVEFIDQGVNFERVSCPLCGKQLSQDWWASTMEAACANGFEELAVLMPCCNAKSSLNDLTYEWPAGFARFVLEAMNPGIDINLATGQVQELEIVLGCSLRTIWAHY
jgi:hypothetical protein